MSAPNLCRNRRAVGVAAVAAILAALIASPAAARPGTPPASRLQLVRPLDAVATIVLPAPVPGPRPTRPGPLPFADPFDLHVEPASDGTWEVLDDGARLWRLRIHAPGATDLNFGFSRFVLPPGATLHVYSEDRDYFQGPYTADDVSPHGQLWTPVVPGDRAVVELYVPAGVLFEPELLLSRVGRGFRDLFGMRGRPKAGDCNIDVACGEADPWRNEIRSVARYSIDGSGLCTGTMIMDVPGDFRNFFLTAAHCGVAPGNAASVVVYWNFESPSCGEHAGGSLLQNQTGAVFRAAEEKVDFALLELEEDPPASFNVYYAGWDRSGFAPPASVVIHHPNGDEKAISFNDDELTTSDSCIGDGFSTHWLVDDWESGTTEPGSSGSALFDAGSRRIVGTLSGGDSSCNTAGGSDCFGKFSLAWDRGVSPATRLRDWLDPEGIGPLSIPGSGRIQFASGRGVDVCPPDAERNNGIWEPGETVEMAVALRGSTTFGNVRGTLTSSTAGVVVLDGEATWANLSPDENVLSDPPHFTIQLAEWLGCGTPLDFQLDVLTDEGGPIAVRFSDVVGSTLAPVVPLAIPDRSEVSSALRVGYDAALEDVNVFVKLSHTWVGDLVLKLRGPSGKEVVLLDRPGIPSPEGGCGDDDLNATFDGSASFDPEGHCAGTNPWYTGAALPVQDLAAFEGESSRGLWQLVIADRAADDAGTLQSWELITTPPVVTGCGVCPSGAGAATATATVTHTATSTTSPPPTFTTTHTATGTRTLPFTSTPTGSPTGTFTRQATATATASATETSSATVTPTASDSATPTGTPPATATFSAAPAPSDTVTDTPSPSPGATATATATAAAAATSTPAPTAVVSCAGDCDGNGAVSIDELLRAVGIALAVQPAGSCDAADPGRDGVVTIDELVRAVNNSLDGC